MPPGAFSWLYAVHFSSFKDKLAERSEFRSIIMANLEQVFSFWKANSPLKVAPVCHELLVPVSWAAPLWVETVVCVRAEMRINSHTP